MAYTDDAVKAKLSSLNETQDGIVTVAQWIMFHRRHADKTAQLWMQRLKDSTSNKRLNMIYLANEVVQQSKVRRKTEFVSAFSPIIVESTAVAYKGATYDVQQKIRRVIEVWRQRQIFDLQTQEAIEAKVDDVDRNRGSGKKAALGGSIFSSSEPSAPAELQPLIPLQTALTKAESNSQTTASSAESEYNKITAPSATILSPPVQAARLNVILKSLANAEGAVAESIKARHALMDALEKIMDTHRAALTADESHHKELYEKRQVLEARKREVEDNIMRGLTAESTIPYGNGSPSTPMTEPARPDVEQLTPPPVEAFTPTGSPSPAHHPGFDPAGTADNSYIQPESSEDQSSIHQLLQSPANTPVPNMPGADLLASLTATIHSRPMGDEGVNEDGASTNHFKKRKTGADVKDEFAEFASGEPIVGIDAEVAEMLGRE